MGGHTLIWEFLVFQFAVHKIHVIEDDRQMFFFALLSSSGADHNLTHLRIHFSDHWFNSYTPMTGNYLKQNNCDNCCKLVIDNFLLRPFRDIITSNNEVFKSFTFSRSSHWRCSVKNGVLRNLAKFAGKHLCQSLFLIKLQV